MSPIHGLLILFLLRLFASLSHFAAATAVNGDEKALKRRRLRQHKKAAEEEDTAVLPSSSMSHQQFPNKLFDFSLRKQDHSLPSSLRDDGAFLTFSSTVGKRQVADSDLQCKDSQSLFRVEVNTDDYPSETSWKLVDVISNTVVLKKIDFETESSLYVEKKCLESNNCYQFTIKDSYGDGLSFGLSGSYKVEYDNQLIKEGGGDFGEKEESEFFGDAYACDSLPSFSPSQSQTPTTFPSRIPSAHPTNSQKPTSFPTGIPSFTPSSSFEPTSSPTDSQKPTAFPSRIPSSTPSLSFEPTSSPTYFQGFISYGYDDLNRRYFPSPLLREDMSKSTMVSYHTWPNCSDTEGDRRVGCVSIPKSTSIMKSPSWAGTLHSGKAPICKRGKCDLQTPMSNNALRIEVSEAHLGHFLQSKANIELLTDEEMSTSVVLVADVNGDGWPDIVIGNQHHLNQLLLNQGNGEFKEVADAFPSENWSTTAIGVADINDDGFPDLIIGGNYDEEDKLLLNQGDGMFKEKLNAIPTKNVGMSTTSILAIADLNSDGLLDVIAPNRGVLLNQGNSTFVEVSGAISSYIKFATSIVVADVNGDGNTDIISCTWFKPDQVLLNLGNGTFEELQGSIPNASSDHTTAISAADLDGDGAIDLVVGSGNPAQPIRILLNQGNGTFEEGGGKIPSGFHFIPQTIAIADMDGDGRLDILVGTSKDRSNYLLQNQGNGNFQTVEGAFDEAADGKNTSSIAAVSDVNADGSVDVIFGNENNPIQVLLNNVGAGSYLEVSDAIPGANDRTAEAIAVADLDGDGLPDLVVGNGYLYYAQPNEVFLNQGDGTFQEVISDVSSGDMETFAVAVGDLNGDGLPDIVIGNRGQNQIMLNQGDGIFRESNLSVDDYETYALALADVNGDGHLDILVGNGFYFSDGGAHNQLFINQGDGIFVEVDGAIPGNFNTWAIAVADFNNDGFIDIIIGNYSYGQPNQLLLNQGDGTFQEIEAVIPGYYRTRSISVADVNGDGFIDIIVGNSWDSNQLLLNRGNDIFEEKADALPNDYFDTHSIAVGDIDGDGHPDLLFGNYNGPIQLALNEGDGTFSEAVDMIPLFEEFLGVNSIAFADFNNDGRLDIVVGNNGQRNQLLLSSDCPDGGARLHGSSWCFPCPSFMGVTIPSCRECSPDHIQDESNEQCSPDPCSSFEERKMGNNTCTPCPDGSFYNSSIIRLESQPSSFLQDRCVPCEAGTFYSNAIHAISVDQCNSCPPRLSSSQGSSSCSYCNEEYILNSTFNGASLETFENASNEETCLKCPPIAQCDFNTTLETLGVPPSYWRGSLHTSVLYLCDGRNSERCIGNSTKVLAASIEDYCVEGYHGPLCKLCESENKYFKESNGKCEDCSHSSLLALRVTAVVVTLSSAFLVARSFGRKYQRLRFREFQTKFKILISFYQVAATFQGVYGMRLHEKVAGILDFISYLSFGFFEVFFIPAECVGSKKDQLLIIVLAPIFVLMLAGAWFFIVALANHDNWKNQFLNVALVTFYLVLPGVCNSIFSVIQCEHFVTRDDPEEYYSSYLKDDFSIECDKSNSDYSSLLVIFFVSLLLWPILVNILWIYLIARIWRPVRTNRITPLANACRFLWRDYQPAMMCWDIIDMVRKIVLTGVIACIDMRASTEVVRLIIAGVISFVYVVFLTTYRPYKRGDDHYLAVVSSIMLTCCFLMGIILNICDDGDDYCKEMIGFGSEYTASVVVVVLTLSTLVISVLLFLGYIFLTITHPVLTLKSGVKPNLAMNAESKCKFHAFFSHKWSDGKPKNYAIVRKIQLIMPDMRIWLDVDDIVNSDGNLEQAVTESLVFIAFLSKGYFASKNCRREIYAAVCLGKPVIVIYEGDKSALESMMNECRRYCTIDNDILSKLLNHLEENSIPWVDGNIFSAKALNIICTKILSNLPYYQAHPEELEDGVLVPGELGSVRLTSAVNIIICRSNKGSSEIANELVPQAGVYSRNIILSDPIADDSELDSLLLSTQGEMDKVMILYLNQDVFENDAEKLTGVLKHAIDEGIEIILLHELDPEREGCEFDNFFHQTPMELLEEPYNIYSKIAVPLHGYEDYRELGLKRVICKLGAEEVSEGIRARFSNSFRDSFIISQV